MREEYRLKYLSNRVLLLGVVTLVYFVIEAVHNVLLGIRGEETVLQAGIYVLLALGYFMIVWFGIILPYRRSELLVHRFLDGYLTHRKEDRKSVV